MSDILPTPERVEDDISLSAYIDLCIGTMNDTVQNAKSTTQGAGVTAVDSLQSTVVIEWNAAGSQMAAFGFKPDQTPNELLLWQAGGTQIITAINSVPLHVEDSHTLDNILAGAGQAWDNVKGQLPSFTTLKWVGIGALVLGVGVLIAYVVRAFK